MRKTLSEILVTFRLIIDTVIAGAADVAEVLALVKSKGQSDWKVYQSGLIRIALIVIIIPIPMLVLGISGSSCIWISTAGLIWTLFTLLLALLATPIALVIDAVWQHSMTGLGRRYVRLTMHILFAELSFALLLVFIPIKNRPEIIPLLVLLALIIFIGARLFGVSSIINGRTITVIASIAFLAIIWSLFFPKTAELVANFTRGLDNATLSIFTEKPRSSPLASLLPSAKAIASTPMITVSEEEAARGFVLDAGLTAQTISAPKLSIEANREYMLLDSRFYENRKSAGCDHLVQSVPGPLTVKAIHDNTKFVIRRS